VAAIIAYFPNEEEAQRVIRGLALETSIRSITYINSAEQTAVGTESSLYDTLYQQGFDPDQCQTCLTALNQGRVAVMMDCDDPADMLVALHSYGVNDYHLA